MPLVSQFFRSPYTLMIGASLFGYGLLFDNSGNYFQYRIWLYHVFAGSLILTWLLLRQGAGWRLCAAVPPALACVGFVGYSLGS